MNSIHVAEGVSDHRHGRKCAVPSGIDHIVITVNDLDEATASFSSLGFNVIFGGHHEHRPSSNLLIPFADGSYIELIGFRPHPTPIVDPWWDLHQTGEGLVDFALLSEGLERDLERLQNAGVSARGPITGGRTRPDGQRVDWLVVRIAASAGARPPFVIEDVTPTSLRIPSGADATHDNGIERIAGITILVESLETAAPLYEAVTGTKGSTNDSSLGDGAATIRFLVGKHWIELIEATTDELRATLALRGSGPYQFTLEKSGAPGAPQIVHGARMIAPEL